MKSKKIEKKYEILYDMTPMTIIALRCYVKFYIMRLGRINILIIINISNLYMRIYYWRIRRINHGLVFVYFLHCVIILVNKLSKASTISFTLFNCNNYQNNYQ